MAGRPKSIIVKEPSKKKNVTWTEDKLIKLGEELISFVTNNPVFHISKFTESKQHHTTWWYWLMGKHPILKDYHKRAVEILGNRIAENGFGANNPWLIQKFIPCYFNDVKNALTSEIDEEYERRLKFQKHVEKYKHELSQKSDEEMKAKIDSFDISMTMMQKLMHYEKLLKEHGILDDTTPEQAS